jgi:hypothetical protein
MHRQFVLASWENVMTKIDIILNMDYAAECLNGSQSHREL